MKSGPYNERLAGGLAFAGAGKDSAERQAPSVNVLTPLITNGPVEHIVLGARRTVFLTRQARPQATELALLVANAHAQLPNGGGQEEDQQGAPPHSLPQHVLAQFGVFLALSFL